MLTLSQKIVGLIAIGLIIYSLFVLQTQEQLIESTLLNQAEKQALVFLHGLEREIAAFPEPLDPKALQDLIVRSSHDKEELEFSVFRLYIYDTDGNVLADTNTQGERRKPIDGYVKEVLRSGKSYLGKELEWPASPSTLT